MRALPFGAASLIVLAHAASAQAAATWQPTTTAAPFDADTALLLTDGSVLVHALATPLGYGSGSWYKLTPDLEGSYVNGSWSQVATMPTGYAPLYFTSAVLPDGRVLVEGGEYNGTSTAETNLGAIYDPVANTWAAVAPPTGWSNIGDGASVVLGDGTLLMGNAENAAQALFDAATLKWTTTGTGKADANSEEGFTLLPDGKVLAIDVVNEAQPVNAELYDPATGAWSGAGNTGVQLVDAGEEIGPALLLPNGSVFAIGATGNTAIFHPPTSTKTFSWETGPKFPLVGGKQVGAADGSAAVLPSGHVLCFVSPGDYETPVSTFLYDGTKLDRVGSPPGTTGISSYNVRLLVLPTGQILYTDGGPQAEVYTPTGAPKAGWEPEITGFPASVTAGTTYTLHGKRLNGLTVGAAYGDDAQMATNYPLVRITNVATGHVFYGRTHDHSTMAVHTGNKIVSTKFEIGAATEKGASMLEVVANGIPSAAVSVTVH